MDDLVDKLRNPSHDADVLHRIVAADEIERLNFLLNDARSESTHWLDELHKVREQLAAVTRERDELQRRNDKISKWEGGGIEVSLDVWRACQKDAERLKGLRELCGYVENGSDEVVHIYQDDATHDWGISVGSTIPRKRSWHGRSFTSAIDAAIAAMKEQGK